MKSFYILFILVIALLHISCEQQKGSIDESKKATQNSWTADSLRLKAALEEAISLAKSKLDEEPFTKEYEIYEDSSYEITVNIRLGKLFKNRDFLIIRRTTPFSVATDVFNVTNQDFKNIISSEHGGLTFISDTIADINGDELPDFLLHWYPASGCCLRNKYDTYLLQPDGTFSQVYSFINPTFFSSEKVIRGVLYGHQEDVGLYKYQWNGSAIDTIEYIYKNPDKPGQFIRIKQMYLFEASETDKVYLKNIPKEYLGIEDYDWFKDE